LARSETQVIRYKSTAEAAEKAEADLKVERRKLQREVSMKSYSGRSHLNLFSRDYYLIPNLQLQPLMIEIWDECHCQ